MGHEQNNHFVANDIVKNASFSVQLDIVMKFLLKIERVHFERRNYSDLGDGLAQ